MIKGRYKSLITLSIADLALLAIGLLIVYGHPASADDVAVGVLYPDMREPYKAVFVSIIAGIKEEIKGPVKTYELKQSDDPTILLAELEDDRVEVVIALGKRGLNAARELPKHFDILIGAVLVTPDTNGTVKAGITLTPDPDVMFRRLKALAPEVQHVVVIYNPKRSDWLIERAQRAASRHGLTLEALTANDLKEAAPLYRDVISKADPSYAVWLPQDRSTVDKSTILPMILEAAWDKRFVVFSSSLAHVGKGALFSLYPDNTAMGRSLGALATGSVEHRGGGRARIVPLRDLQIAVNLRTAKRLGLRINGAQARQFGLVFPSR
jgi:putative ABC transport system substrate-binding protein